jgi:hypothetical protein
MRFSGQSAWKVNIHALIQPYALIIRMGIAYMAGESCGNVPPAAIEEFLYAVFMRFSRYFCSETLMNTACTRRCCFFIQFRRPCSRSLEATFSLQSCAKYALSA